MEKGDDSPGMVDRHRPADPHATQYAQGKTFRRPCIHNKYIGKSVEEKWYQILGIFTQYSPRNIRGGILFSMLQHALKTVDSRKVKLTFHAHDQLKLW